MAWRAASSETWIILGAVSLLLTLLLWNVFSPSGSAGRGRKRRVERALVAAGAVLRRLRFRLHHPGHLYPAMAREEIADPAVFGWAWPAFAPLRPPRRSPLQSFPGISLTGVYGR